MATINLGEMVESKKLELACDVILDWMINHPDKSKLGEAPECIDTLYCTLEEKYNAH